MEKNEVKLLAIFLIEISFKFKNDFMKFKNFKNNNKMILV